MMVGLMKMRFYLKMGVWNIIENGTNKIMCMRALLEFIFINFFFALFLSHEQCHTIIVE